MTTVDAYIRGATEYGPPREYWEVALADLGPADLGRLALALRALPPRKRERPFALTRVEKAELAALLVDAGAADVDIRRWTGVSPAKLGEIRQTPSKTSKKAPIPRAISRNKTDGQGDCPRTAVEGLRSALCEWCGDPIHSTRRADARYCHRICRVAAHRARGERNDLVPQDAGR